MGAYVYCHQCEAGYGPPGLAECILQEYNCKVCEEPLLVDFKHCLVDHIENMVDAMQGFNEQIGDLYKRDGGIDPRDDEQWNGL